MATLDEFVESKSYVVCVLTPDAKFVLVGEPTETRMFALTPADDPTPAADDVETGGRRRQRPVARFPTSYPASALAVSADGKWAFVGQSFDCLFSVLDIDIRSSSFGQVSRCSIITGSLCSIGLRCPTWQLV